VKKIDGSGAGAAEKCHGSAPLVQSYLITEIVHTVEIVHRRNCTHPLSKLFTLHPKHGIWKTILKYFAALFYNCEIHSSGYSFGVYKYHRKHVFSFGMGIVSTFLGKVSTAEIFLLKKCKINFFL